MANSLVIDVRKLTGRAVGVRLQEHRQQVSQRDVRAYTRSTSRSLASEQSKSAVSDHAITLNHVIDWDQAKVVDRQSNRTDRWIKEAIHIRKEQDKSMNRDDGSYRQNVQLKIIKVLK